MSGLEELAPAEWDELLARLGVDDVYLQSAYLESASLLGQGTPAYLHAPAPEGGVLFPCLVREAPDGYADVGTPMGYGGPVRAGATSSADAFFDAYDRWCAERRVVATFVRFHPVLANQRLAEGRWHVEQIGHSVAWRVAGRGRDDLVAALTAHHRRVARKAAAGGVQVRAAREPEDLDEFVALYEETMRRRAASSFYFFPPAYWRLLRTKLRSRLLRFDAELDAEVVASILCLRGGPLLHYHLGCSSEAGQSAGANHLLFLEAAMWAAGAGFASFHLGGGVGGFDDSLYEFKRRFDPGGAVPACLGKRVHDEKAYLSLSGAEAVDYAGYFPAYRVDR